MVSSEIEDKIDRSQMLEISQIEENEEQDETDSVIVLHLESEKDLLAGLLQDYKYQNETDGDKITIQFISNPANTVGIHAKLEKMNRIRMTKGEKEVVSHDISFSEVRLVRIQQSIATAGCVITVVYK